MLPADIVNQALDSLGIETWIGDLEEGTREARAALRWYGPTLRQLLRAANWNFARKQARLTLLNDRTGQTTQRQIANGWPVTVGTGTQAMGPWIYEYEWPIDAMRARFVPAQPAYEQPGQAAPPSPMPPPSGGDTLVDNQGNVLTDDQGNVLVDGGGSSGGDLQLVDAQGNSLIDNQGNFLVSPGSSPPPPTPVVPSNVPLMGGLATYPIWMARQVPARFLVTQDTIPPMIGVASSWSDRPDLADIQGRGPAAQTVILTNVPCATLVYTALIVYPGQWDPLFRQAFVAMLASWLAMPLVQDKKLALTMRAQQVAVAKQALTEARIGDGDEGWPTSDIPVDWLRARVTGGWGNPWNGAGGEIGVLGYGWTSCGFADGSAY
jgi:hypothetical protein